MKIILAILTLLFSLQLQAQAGAMVVNDPLANQSLITSISQGAKQIDQGLKQLEYLEKAKEAVSKVNSVIKDLKEIKEIYQMQKEILIRSQSRLRQLQQTDLFKPNEMRDIAQSFNNLIDNSVKSIDALQKLLKDNLFKMTDAERLEFIRQIKEEIQVKHTDTDVLYQKYIKIAESRALNELFKKD